MKKATWLVVAVSLVLSGLASSQEWTNSSKRIIQVPFDFMIANKIVPAGKYQVKAATPFDSSVLTIGNAGSSLYSITYKTEHYAAAAHYSLVFEKYGNRYFLREFRLGGSKIAYHFPISKVERELAAQNITPHEEILQSSAE